MMLGRKPFSIMAGLLAVSAAPFGAHAMDAHSEEAVGEPVAASQDGVAAQYTLAGQNVVAYMPCAEPIADPAPSEGMKASICIMGDVMVMFVASQGPAQANDDTFGSDFDAVYEEIETSRDTASIEEFSADGRRAMRATRGPDPDFGLMQAIQIAPDAVVYTVGLARPGMAEALPEADKQVIRDFVNSLEITP